MTTDSLYEIQVTGPMIDFVYKSSAHGMTEAQYVDELYKLHFQTRPAQYKPMPSLMLVRCPSGAEYSCVVGDIRRVR